MTRYGGKPREEIFIGLQNMEYLYVAEGQVGDSYAAVGTSRLRMIYPLRDYEIAYLRFADRWSTRFTYDSNFASSTYSFGFPTHVDEWSTTSGDWAGRRRTDTVYAHNKTKWVLGRPSTVTRNDKLFDSATYDTLGRLLTRSKFGTLRETYTYSTVPTQLGAVATWKDSHNHTYTLSNYERGIPKSFLRPDGLTFTREVSDHGEINSETDARGFTTGFGYNLVGWLTSVDRPAPFNDSATVYSGQGTGVVAVTTRGPRRTTINYDPMHRPILVASEATDGSAAAIYEKTSYDIYGRETYKSWPSASSVASEGVFTGYDPLNRPTTVQENVTPFATTNYAYLTSPMRTRVTDPSGAQTTTTLRGFSSPFETETTEVVDPLGATTTMTRNIYGDIITLAQSGTQNGYTASVVRDFWYDANLRLCRHRAPEFGSDEVFLYDSEGLLTSSGRGQAAAAGCVASIGTSIRVTRTYDNLHRETGVTFPSGTPSITRTYDGNGNVLTAKRGTLAANPKWTYAYNALDRITQEKLEIDSRTYTFDYAYNNNGDVSSRTRVGSATGAFLFDPDAYGRPRSARTSAANYIAGVSYHPNGLSQGAGYLNGQLLSQTLDARQKPWVLKTTKTGSNAVWQTYAYDARGKVSSVTDTINAAENRSFAYDGPGRLLTASGPWGSGSYGYDALNNTRSRTEGSTASTINYAANNRVTSAVIGGATRNFQYDLRGNTTNDGRNTFTYDFTNQPTAVSGSTTAAYTYDANLKRVKTVAGGQTTYSAYSRVSGGLILRDELASATLTDYVSAGGASLRLKRQQQTTTPEYIHADALGSPIAATNAAGSVTWRESYTPFGDTRLKPAANDNSTGFTGHLRDKNTALVYMQARLYDPSIGRFLSTDPIGYQDQLNLYAYVYNDPVNNTDPTGECPWCLGAILGGGIELGSQLLTQEGRQAYAAAGAALARGDLGGALNAAGANVARVAISAAAGAVGQAGAGQVAKVAAVNAQGQATIRAAEVTAAVGNVAGNTAVGATVGATAQAASNVLTGENGSIGAAALGGGAGGAAGSLVSLAGSGSAQLLADATGKFIGTSGGQVAAPLAGQGAKEAALEVAGTVAAQALDNNISCGVDGDC